MDWRSSLTPQSRADVIQKLIEVVKLAAPSQDQSKLSELAASTEQAIFEKSKSRVSIIYLIFSKNIFSCCSKRFQIYKLKLQ